MGYKWAINGCACVIAGRGMNICAQRGLVTVTQCQKLLECNKTIAQNVAAVVQQGTVVGNGEEAACGRGGGEDDRKPILFYFPARMVDGE